jgi:hypothetical protein
LDIHGLDKQSNENTKSVVRGLAQQLNLNPNDVEDAQRVGQEKPDINKSKIVYGLNSDPKQLARAGCKRGNKAKYPTIKYIATAAISKYLSMKTCCGTNASCCGQ